MSKIGKISISIPEKVKAVLSGNVLNIEGPLGKKSLNIDLEMFNLDITEGRLWQYSYLATYSYSSDSGKLFQTTAAVTN